ncbi:hypothetical protein G7072_02640 [Nocardioides sp. HDW12B]|uniref:polysaccharide lyase n=1 Tax=Nocardioides sp. HDW12B TaxID=2714939 RepID=UPI00140E1608|nr:hypothetical protein [Nocardioides sp. HDW12B]QIK65383.1 hypothetical protein G7072_02640 [Nocardioides sp. HDW12B]
MLRRTTTVFMLALATALPLGTATVATGTASAEETRTTTLRFADFDTLRAGQMSGAEFAEAIGGPVWADGAFDDSSVVDAGGKSGKVYRIDLDAGTIRDNPHGNHGIVAAVPLARQVDNACIRYRVRFGSGFDWSKGGKLPGLSGVAPGVSPTAPTGGGNPGDKGWSGRLMWGSGGSLSSYLYYPSQTSYYGQGFAWGTRAGDGGWHVLRQCYTMNTVGRANGVMRAWLDGQQVLSRTDMVYRLNSRVRISHIMWAVFRGGATLDWAGQRDSHIDFDRLRITTSG